MISVGIFTGYYPYAMDEVIRRINPEIRLILIAEQSGADFEWYLNNGMIDRFMLKEEFAEEFAEMFG